ncbi:hypothetical protein SAMN05444162_0087 [Paenibacillaceae bacterium GAS479]|nr:hypothetical protein SAMN05444162_0087 [Paenibacillaceae bacterium GAS479]
MNKSDQYVSISNYKSSLGIILVLFILLVIVSNVFFSPFQEDPPVDDDISALGSVSIDVKNGTGSYLMTSTSLTGDFEPPGPSPHTIQPGGRYNFQLLTNSHASAIAIYNITSTNGVRVGGAVITMSWAGRGIFFKYGVANATVTGPFKVVKEDAPIVRIDNA